MLFLCAQPAVERYSDYWDSHSIMKKKKKGRSPERVSVGEEGEATARREAEDGRGAGTDRGVSGVRNLEDERQYRKQSGEWGSRGKCLSSSSSTTIHAGQCCSLLVLLMCKEGEDKQQQQQQQS